MLRRLLVMVAVLALVAAACGDDDSDDDISAGGGGTTVADDSGGDEPAGDAAAEGEATVAVGETSLGSVLVGGDGMTLYLFTPDSAEESTCTDACAETWPPLTVEGDPTAGEGVDQAKLATITRGDGSTQVTYAGHPLYFFAPDEQPGDVTGQGVNDVWWVVSPDGEAIQESGDARGAGY